MAGLKRRHPQERSSHLLQFNVPRTTLQDRISGRVVHGVKPGPKPYLNKAEESELAEFLGVTSCVGGMEGRENK